MHAHGARLPVREMVSYLLFLLCACALMHYSTAAVLL